MHNDDAFATQPIDDVFDTQSFDTVGNDAWVEAAPVTETVSLDKRQPVVLVLDTSHSMNFPDLQPISQLNAGLQTLRASLLEDNDARRRVDVALVTFGGTPQIRNLRQGEGTVADAHEAFVATTEFNPPKLTGEGITPMGAAMLKALEIVEARKLHYRAQDLPYFRPWLMLITDGAATDSDHEWQQAVQQMQSAQEQKKVVLFPIGVVDADFDKLNQLVWKDPAHPDRWRPAMKLQGLKFEDLFLWLSASIGAILDSSEDDTQVQFPSPMGWAQMDL